MVLKVFAPVGMDFERCLLYTSCTYLRQGDTPAYMDASIEEFPDLERARERLAALPGGFADQAPGTDSEVLFAPGQKIERHRGTQYSGAFWLSLSLIHI